MPLLSKDAYIYSAKELWKWLFGAKKELKKELKGAKKELKKT